MLIIRRPQREALQAGLDRRFVRSLVARLIEEFPGTLSGVANDLEADARTALGRARAHGLREDRDLVAFVEVALLVSPRFDEHPAFAAALRDQAVPPEHRMDALLATLTDEAWDEASRLR